MAKRKKVSAPSLSTSYAACYCAVAWSMLLYATDINSKEQSLRFIERMGANEENYSVADSLLDNHRRQVSSIYTYQFEKGDITSPHGRL